MQSLCSTRPDASATASDYICGTADFWLVHLKYEAVVAKFHNLSTLGPPSKKAGVPENEQRVCPDGRPKDRGDPTGIPKCSGIIRYLNKRVSGPSTSYASHRGNEKDSEVSSRIRIQIEPSGHATQTGCSSSSRYHRGDKMVHVPIRRPREPQQKVTDRAEDRSSQQSQNHTNHNTE